MCVAELHFFGGEGEVWEIIFLRDEACLFCC